MAKVRLEQALTTMKSKEGANAKFEAGISTLAPLVELVKAASEVRYCAVATWRV